MMADIQIFVLLLLPAVGLASYSNVAAGKTAKHSSLYPWYGGEASKAVDGNADPNWDSCSCSHTSDEDTSPWWYVDLGGTYIIKQVVITNRGDCCGERLANFTVEVFEDDPESPSSPRQRCYRYGGVMPGGATEALTCERSTFGRYVRIAKDTPILTLCEVQVLGIGYSNVAAGKTAKHSSLYPWYGGEASKAVDGNADPNWESYSCSHASDEDTSPWWYVDLGGTYIIKQVVITNRGDCCGERLANFTVEVFEEDPESSSSSRHPCYRYRSCLAG